jgi:hypothetical protein
MKRNLTLLFAAGCLILRTNAQEAPAALSNDSLTKEVAALKHDVGALKNLKISGWIQSQFQYIDTRGAANFDGGTFSPNSDKRIMIRRGRVKFTYNGKNSQYVMQINGTERGLNLTEIFGVATDPWIKTVSLVVGVMNRPFGFEIDQSSAVRESPERSRYTQILMPNERDLGAKIVIAPPKGKPLHGLRLDAGFYNGQGVFVPGTGVPSVVNTGSNAAPGQVVNYGSAVIGVNEFDYRKDFICRLSYYTDLSPKVKFGIGASHYNGGILYANNRYYSEITEDAAGKKAWKISDTISQTFKGKTAPRIYTGVEAFFSVSTGLGTTTIRGEYITGTQPGTRGNSASPFYEFQLGDTYQRNFDGAYAYFIQRIGKSKHEVLVKGEWYDPNTSVTGKDIVAGSFTAGDIRYEQIGLGYNYYMYENVKFMFHYNIVRNEATGLVGTTALNDLSKDLKDNVFTLRMQYRF